MRLSLLLLPLASVALADTWLSRAAYNKWHQSELESWLDDHSIAHPKAADRRDLYELVQKNWDNYVVPYTSWDTEQLTSYLKDKKHIHVDESKTTDANWLVSQVRNSWYETEDKASSAYTHVKDWILDSWSDNQLKAFCDRNGIPVPQPRERDVLLQKARQNYESVAKKSHQTVGYPGNWLYDTWTESDLKEWLDKHGFPAPQPSSRDKLIATVRRNSYLAYLQMEDESKKAKEAVHKAYSSLSDTLLNSWSESQLKTFADKNGIKVPQGTRTNELRALIRHRRAQAMRDTVTDKVGDTVGAATTKAGNEYARATDAAGQAASDAFNNAVGAWSESRLKAFLDARGVPVPQKSSVDELRALVRKNAYKASTGWSAWTFDDFSVDTLKNYLAATGDEASTKIASKSDAAREDLLKAAKSYYATASKTGGEQYDAATSFLGKTVQAAKDNLFDTWSDSDIKAYLDSYGIPVPQGSTPNEVRAFARQQATYFRYGTTTPAGTLYAKASEGFWHSLDWAKAQIQVGADVAKKQADALRKKYNDEL